MPLPTATDDHTPPDVTSTPSTPPAPSTPPGPPASLALVREVQGPSNDRGRVAGLAMVCSAAGVALGFALAGSLFAAMAPPARSSIGPAGYSSCSRGHGHGHRSMAVEPQLIDSRPVAWFGVTVQTGLRPLPAVLTGVVDGTPADAAGLQPGDLITSFNGREVHSSQELLTLIRAHQPGDVVGFEARTRDGRALAVDGLRLSTMPMVRR